jgi:ribosomal protein S18 acetylase RimI-like enzyme
MNIIIDTFNMEMYETVRDLWLEVGFKLGVGDDRDGIAQLLSHNPGLLLIAKDGLSIIGSVLGTTDGRRGYIYHLAIHPSYQQQNIGSKLLEELFNRFRKQGIKKVHGFVLNSNESVAHFYEKHGCYRRTEFFVMSKDL